MHFCPQCKKEMIETESRPGMGNDTLMCLSCNLSFPMPRPKNDSSMMGMWIIILGLIALAAFNGSVNPQGVIVVLVAAGAFHLYHANKK
jgi:hypothetical protein